MAPRLGLSGQGRSGRPFPCTYRVGGCGHGACRRERAEAAIERASCRDCVWGRACAKHQKGDLR